MAGTKKPYLEITMSELHRQAGSIISQVFFGRVPVLVRVRGKARAFIFPAVVLEEDSEEGTLTTLVPTTINIHRPADD